MHGRDIAGVKADLADADLAPGLTRGHGRRPVAVEHLHELDAAWPDRRCAARLEHRDPRARRPTRERLEPGELRRDVEEDAIEPDVAAVERDRLVDVTDTDTDVIDSLEGAHAALTDSLTSPVSARISRIRSMLAGSVTGSRGGRTSPVGCPSIPISTLSWLW